FLNTVSIILRSFLFLGMSAAVPIAAGSMSHSNINLPTNHVLVSSLSLRNYQPRKHQIYTYGQGWIRIGFYRDRINHLIARMKTRTDLLILQTPSFLTCLDSTYFSLLF